MTKTFNDYLAESKKEYKFRLKFAGLDVDSFDEDVLESLLDKYQLVSISKAKTTPIQEHPLDFAALSNTHVVIYDIVVSYPTTPQVMMSYLTQGLRWPASHLLVMPDHFAEREREEGLQNSDEYATLLDSDLEDTGDFDIEYGDLYNDKMLSELETLKYEFSVKPDTVAQVDRTAVPKSNSPVGSTANKLPDVKSAAR